MREHGEVSWYALGAGRMLRAPTVFEDVIKTICTPIRRPMAGPHDAFRMTESRMRRATRSMLNTSDYA